MRSSTRTLVIAGGLLLAAVRASAAAEAPASPGAPAASPSPVDPAWARAREECISRAVRETETVTPQGQASKAAIGIYVECMKAKGFPVHGR